MLPARYDDDDDLLTEVVQSDKYYKSRADGVTSEVGQLLTEIFHSFLSLCFSASVVFKKHGAFYTSAISEVTWYEPLYNTNVDCNIGSCAMFPFSMFGTKLLEEY